MRANDGATTLELRKELAAKAYARTAAYDAAISQWFAATLGEELPEWRAFGGRLQAAAALRREPAPARRLLWLRRRAPRRGDGRAAPGQGAVLQQPQRHRRGPGACRRAWPAAGPPVAIIKHANPCGVAIGATLKDAYLKALRCDPVERLRRHRRPQRHHRRGGGRGDRQDLHRGGHRARMRPTRRRRSSPPRRTCGC